MSKPRVEDHTDEQGRNWYGIESENLCEATFKDGVLRVRFNSTRTWEYRGVPEETWLEFKATFASGASKFFGANFRNWKGLSSEVKG